MRFNMKAFPVRAYSKSQLAQFYKDEACYNTLMLWLKHTVKLLPEFFDEDDYNPKGHILNSYQVIAFIVHHGTPEGFCLDENDSRIEHVKKQLESARAMLSAQKQ